MVTLELHTALFVRLRHGSINHQSLLINHY